MRREHHLCGILPQIHDFVLPWEYMRPTQIEGHFIKYLMSTPQNVKILKANKERPKTCHRLEELSVHDN